MKNKILNTNFVKNSGLAIFSTLILNSGLAQAAGFQSPEIHYTFVSKDLVPIKGVTLMADLEYDVMSLKDCSGWICIPSLPHLEMKSDGGKEIAVSSDQGVTILPPKTFKPKSLGAQNVRLVLFTNGILDNLCGGQKKDYYQDNFSLFVPTPNQGGMDINAECESKTLAANSQVTEMYCISAFTEAEIKAKVANIVNNCF